MATRTIRPELAPWIRFADALARMQGPSTEIVLHDLTNLAHSVVYVVNGDITDRKVGQGVRHLVPEMLTSHEGKPIGPWWFRYRTKLIRATTELIYDKAGEIIGALCVNEDVTGEERLFLSLEGRLPGLTMTDLKADGDTAGLMTPNSPVSPIPCVRPFFDSSPKQRLKKPMRRLKPTATSGGALCGALRSVMSFYSKAVSKSLRAFWAFRK